MSAAAISVPVPALPARRISLKTPRTLPTASIHLPNQLNRSGKRFQLCYWLLAIALIILFSVLVSRDHAWIIGLAAGILAYPVGNVFQKIRFKSMCKRSKRQNL